MEMSAADFQSFFSTVAGVIPTLLLVLVLEERILLMATRGSAEYESEIHQARASVPQVRWFNALENVSLAFVTPRLLIGLALGAEGFSLIGAGAPSDWMDGAVGGFIAMIVWVFVFLVTLSLLGVVAAGLADITIRATPGYVDPDEIGGDEDEYNSEDTNP
jgi:hypothetical protein